MGWDEMKYCAACHQNVMPTKKFSIVWFIVNCLWLVGGIVYVIYFIMKKKSCPICGNNQLQSKQDNIINSDSIAPVLSKSEQFSKDMEEMNAKSVENLEKSKTKYATAKAKTTETIRKRKAGELPWQIKAAAKKAIREQRKQQSQRS
jgi:hypothetical protein